MMMDNREHIETLLYDKIAGTISEEDNLIVEDAIKNDIEIRMLWQALCRKLEQPAASRFLSSVNTEEAWEKTNARLHARNITLVKSRKLPLVGIAAVLALVLPFVGYYYYHQHYDRQIEYADARALTSASKEIYLKTDDGQQVEIAPGKQVSLGKTHIVSTDKQLTYKADSSSAGQWATLVVPVAKDYKIALSDGTQVWMNAQSVLRFPFQFGKGKREVYLTGEAYFQVAKNKQQEFIVHTDNAAIHVHGTSFNVNSYEAGQFTVALVEGAVSASRDNRQIYLKPGQKAILGGGQLQVKPFDPQEELSWMQGTYFFHNQRLAEIAPVISRWFDVKVAWEKEAVAEQTFTGEIDRKLPLAVVISNLQLSSGIKATIINGVLTFK